MKKQFAIKVTGTESRSDGTDFSIEYDHEYHDVMFTTAEVAREAAESLNPKDFVSQLLTDFSGVSGSVSIEVLTFDVDGEDKDLVEWEDVGGCLITFEECGDGVAMVDGVRIDDEKFVWEN